MLEFRVKNFKELSLEELYELLRLRSDIFVVEQNCVYLDLDGKDHKALHVLGYVNSELAAYTRIFKSGDYFKEASIGRVLVSRKYRQHGFGYDIMNTSIKVVKEILKDDKIRISAQMYLKNFYQNLGFSEQGEEYLEDGIPHIEMILL